MKSIETKRLIIRRFAANDPISDGCYPVDRMNMSFDYSPDMSECYYKNYPLTGGGYFAITLKTTGEIIGRVLGRSIELTRHCL